MRHVIFKRALLLCGMPATIGPIAAHAQTATTPEDRQAQMDVSATADIVISGYAAASQPYERCRHSPRHSGEFSFGASGCPRQGDPCIWSWSKGGNAVGLLVM